MQTIKANALTAEPLEFDLAIEQTVRPSRRGNMTSRAMEELLQGGRVELCYQPQFNLATGGLRGVEALLRVHNREDQLLNPAELVSKAEQGGLISDLGLTILRTACHEFAALRSLGFDLGRLAVNVSPLELKSSLYAEQAMQIIQDAGLAMSDMELEVTESWSLSDPELHLDQLQTLADAGIGLAMDDFGTGHANWASALKLPFKTLKIDRSLITDIASCERSMAVIGSICRACLQLDLHVLAEGVSTDEQIMLLREARCTTAQGYGLGMPKWFEEVHTIKPLTFASDLNPVVLSATS